jgi:hypothetical protein
MTLVAHATLTQLQEPLFNAFAPFVGRTPAPSKKTIVNWAWERNKSHFPEPVGEVSLGTLGVKGGSRRANTYDVMEVLIWYLERPVRAPNAPRATGKDTVVNNAV